MVQSLPIESTVENAYGSELSHSFDRLRNVDFHQRLSIYFDTICGYGIAPQVAPERQGSAVTLVRDVLYWRATLERKLNNLMEFIAGE
jgi:hypothetical protein